MTVENYPFEVDASLRRWSRLFGIRPERCTITLSAAELTVTFGRWTLTTEPANVTAVEIDGPYAPWKVAGPPRLSLADRGITFATSSARGVCIELRRPVGALDPFHLIHHPSLTVTVAEPERFAAELRQLVTAHPASDDAARSKENRPRGTVRHTVRALRRWFARDRSTRVTECDVHHIDAPAPRAAPIRDVQALDEGVGPAFHRRYRIRVADTSMTPADAMALIQRDPNVLTTTGLAPFNRIAGVAEQLAVGDRFIVEMAGPWSGPVEVVEVTTTSFRLATLAGHMEAGTIDFSTARSDGGALQLTIESWARSGDTGMHVLYDTIGTAKQLQSEMWVEACEAFIDLTAGRAEGPVEIDTERAANADS